MRLLDRYLLRELLIPLGYCLCGFLLFWISSDMFVTLGDFQKKELLARDIAEYYVVMLPEFLVLVLPIALLLALLYALTNHARHQEITAIRAAGVSLPYLGVGLLASLALFATNEFWAPNSDDQAKGILKRHLAPDPHAAGRDEYRNLCFNNTRDGRQWVIGVYNAGTGEMINPSVYRTVQSLGNSVPSGRDALTAFGPFTTPAYRRRRRTLTRRWCRPCAPMSWPCRSSRKHRKRSAARSRSGTA